MALVPSTAPDHRHRLDALVGRSSMFDSTTTEEILDNPSAEGYFDADGPFLHLAPSRSSVRAADLSDLPLCSPRRRSFSFSPAASSRHHRHRPLTERSTAPGSATRRPLMESHPHRRDRRHCFVEAVDSGGSQMVSELVEGFLPNHSRHA